jgi:hypothetical protein
MVGNGPKPAFLASDWLVGQFGPDRDHARANFAAFVAAER